MAKEQQKITNFSPAGNRTRVSRVTGGDTHHYTTKETDACVISRVTSGDTDNYTFEDRWLLEILLNFFSERK